MTWPGLRSSILAAEQAARWVALRARPLADDLFRLDLPPLAPVGGEIDAATMDALAGLYLIAQLEQTGMIRSAEILAAERMSLDVRSIEAAEQLDAYTRAAQRWYDERARSDLYARVFGIGPGARDAALANTAFRPTLMELCAQLADWGGVASIDRPPALGRTRLVAQAARRLRSNLAPRQHGNTIVAARTIAEQVRASHDLLQSPGIIALASGRTMWDVVRALWGANAPDIDRLVTDGRSGQRVIAWAGSEAADAGEPSDDVLDAATLWLHAADRDHDEAAA